MIDYTKLGLGTLVSVVAYKHDGSPAAAIAELNRRYPRETASEPTAHAVDTPETGWRSMDTAPRDDTQVFVLRQTNPATRARAYVLRYDAVHRRWVGGPYDYSEHEIIAWMPIPPYEQVTAAETEDGSSRSLPSPDAVERIRRNAQLSLIEWLVTGSVMPSWVHAERMRLLDGGKPR